MYMYMYIGSFHCMPNLCDYMYIHISVTTDWTLRWSGGLLTFYNLSSTVEGSIQISLSDTINTDFTYMVCLRGKQIRHQICAALGDVSSTLNSGMNC